MRNDPHDVPLREKPTRTGMDMPHIKTCRPSLFMALIWMLVITGTATAHASLHGTLWCDESMGTCRGYYGGSVYLWTANLPMYLKFMEYVDFGGVYLELSVRETLPLGTLLAGFGIYTIEEQTLLSFQIGWLFLQRVRDGTFFDLQPTLFTPDLEPPVP